MLTRGLHEITSLLITEYTLDDVPGTARDSRNDLSRPGVGRTRTFFLLKDPSARSWPFVSGWDNPRVRHAGRAEFP